MFTAERDQDSEDAENSTPTASGAIKAFKKGVLYHGIDCNRGPKTDPPILEPAFLLVNR